MEGLGACWPRHLEEGWAGFSPLSHWASRQGKLSDGVTDISLYYFLEPD